MFLVVFITALQFLMNYTLSATLHQSFTTNQMFFELWNILSMFICVAEVYLTQRHCWENIWLVVALFFDKQGDSWHNCYSHRWATVSYFIPTMGAYTVSEPDAVADKCRYKACGTNTLATQWINISQMQNEVQENKTIQRFILT